jgi:iron-sulfur cluster assembly protein
MQSESLSPSETGTAAVAAPAPSKKTVTITDGAVDYAKKRLAQRGTPDAAIRLGVRGGGCSGFSYVIEFADDPPKERDLVFVAGGVRFYVDKKSFVYLAGSALDFEKTLVFSGFKFRNPQEASRCGCGHSFTVR